MGILLFVRIEKVLQLSGAVFPQNNSLQSGYAYPFHLTVRSNPFSPDDAK